MKDHSTMLLQKNTTTIPGFDSDFLSMLDSYERKTIASWVDAGAKVRWFMVDAYGFPNRKETAEAGRMPGFQLQMCRDGIISSLPAPNFSFGLLLDITRVGDVGLKELAELRSLTALDLCFMRVTDVGMKNLAEIKSLTTLSLWTTKVTDAGLGHLAGLNNLTLLNLWHTQVTQAGVKELQKALPKCRISY